MKVVETQISKKRETLLISTQQILKMSEIHAQNEEKRYKTPTTKQNGRLRRAKNTKAPKLPFIKLCSPN